MSKAQLNPAQLAAVHHLSGPCLVIAGAGSGKTSVITQKIAKLMSEGYRPKNIAAITFTNKASQEMRERAKHLVGNKAGSELLVSTFHSLGVRILRQDGRHLGLKEQFSILDSDDVLSVLRDAGQSECLLHENLRINGAQSSLRACLDCLRRARSLLD